MIPNDLPERKKMIERMFQVCWDHIDELTKWERDFIESANGQYVQRENLSDRQCEALEKIYDKL
jgi:hypothetical protein